MSPISRRKLITGGLVAGAGISGLWAADRVARRYASFRPIMADSTALAKPSPTQSSACSPRIRSRASSRAA